MCHKRVGDKYKDMYLKPTVKHGGGSVQVWGCISAVGIGDSVRIEGTMNADKYKQILIHHGILSGRRLISNNFVLQHNNDPNHTRNVVKTYLQNKADSGTLHILEWAPQLPDLYIIELSQIILTGRKMKNNQNQKTTL